eukprot:Nk52_evm84s62 gene=Nk52_evmTU84s62
MVQSSEFSFDYEDITIHCQVTSFDGGKSFMIWLGCQPLCSNMTIAVQTKFQKEPLTTTAFGPVMGGHESFASTIASVMKVPCYISFGPLPEPTVSFKKATLDALRMHTEAERVGY